MLVFSIFLGFIDFRQGGMYTYYAYLKKFFK